MRRGLAWMLALTFLVGGVAACSDDDDGGDDATAEESGGESGDSGADDGGDAGDGNADIEAYCDAVQELVDTPFEEIDQAQVAEVTQEGTDLATNAADLSQEEVQQIADCTEELQGLATGG